MKRPLSSGDAGTSLAVLKAVPDVANELKGNMPLLATVPSVANGRPVVPYEGGSTRDVVTIPKKEPEAHGLAEGNDRAITWKTPRIILEHYVVATYKIDFLKNYVEARCKHCKAIIKGQKNVTSNFIQHTRRRHRPAYDAFTASSASRAKRPRMSSSTNSLLLPPVAQCPPPAPSAENPDARPASSHHAPPQQPVIKETAAEQAPVCKASDSSATISDPKHANNGTDNEDDPTPTTFHDKPSDPDTPPSPRDEHVALLEAALTSPSTVIVPRSECRFAATLSTHLKNHVYFKRDDLQPGGSVHYRAAHAILTQAIPANGPVVTYGHAASAVAAAAFRSRRVCTAVVPKSAPVRLHVRLQSSGAAVEEGGATVQEAKAHARLIASHGGMLLSLEDFMSDDALLGYASAAIEIFQQVDSPDVLFVPANPPSLATAASAIFSRLAPEARIVAVQPDTDVSTFCDKYSFPKSVELNSVGEKSMAAAIESVFEETGTLLTAAGAASVAGLLEYVRTQHPDRLTLIALIDSPTDCLRSMQPVLRPDTLSNASRCRLVVHPPQKTSPPLFDFIRQLSSSDPAAPRITQLRYNGCWPLLVGISCNVPSRTESYLKHLRSLGYRVDNVSSRDVTDEELELFWSSVATEKTHHPNTEAVKRETNALQNTSWGFFRVKLLDDGRSIIRLFETHPTAVQLLGMCYRGNSNGGSSTAVAQLVAKGTETDLCQLEKDLQRRSISVHRERGQNGSMKIFGLDLEDAHNSVAYIGNGVNPASLLPSGPRVDNVHGPSTASLRNPSNRDENDPLARAGNGRGDSQIDAKVDVGETGVALRERKRKRANGHGD